MTFTVNKLRKSLKKKGFVECKKNHHVYLHHEDQGKRTGAYTYYSHGSDNRDVDVSIVGQMRKQLCLDKNSQVYDLVNCPMSADDYLEHLAESGIF